MSAYNELAELVQASKRTCDPVWLKRELHAILQAGEEVAQYFIDNIGKGHKNDINSYVGYSIGCTEEAPIKSPNLELVDLPDIDIDFSDTKRHLVFEYLQNKYGQKYVSKLGNINRLAPLSVMAAVGKRFNVPYSETDDIKNTLFDYSSGDERYGHALEDTLKGTSPGRRFLDTRPTEADCLATLESHPSHSGVHAAAILVCNEPITNFCTVNEEGVAHIDKKDSEYLNLLKIDALGLRTLGIIEDAGVMTQDELYALHLDDAAAISVIEDGRICDIFQFSGRALVMVADQFEVNSFKHIDHITALARPGPLSSGMEETYIKRELGLEPITYEFPEIEIYLKDTNGVIIYQEQIMQIVREIGGFDWKKTATTRKAMSGSMGAEFFEKLGQDFVDGAVARGHDEVKAAKIWHEIAAYGAWAFNKAHSVSYAIISYWCCYIKAHYPIEWAAANLRGAKDETQTIEILREMVREGVEYTAIDPELSELNWVVRNGRLLGGIMNVVGFGPVKAAKYIEKRSNGTLTDAEREKMLASKCLYTDLREAHSLFGALYKRPRLVGCYDDIIELNKVQDKQEAVVIAKMVKKVLSSENEPQRVKKRNGKPWPSNDHEFMDIHAVDDSVSMPYNFRIRPENYALFGRDIFENDAKGSWYLIRGWKIPNLQMIIVKKIKKLDPDKYKDI